MRSLLVALGAVGIAVSGVVVAPVANAATAPTCPDSGNTTSESGNSQTYDMTATRCDKIDWDLGTGITSSDFTLTQGGSPLSRNSTITYGDGAADVIFTYTGSVSGQVTVVFSWTGGFGREATRSDVLVTGSGSGGDSGSGSDSGGGSGSGSSGSSGSSPAAATVLPTVQLQALDLFDSDWMPADESALVGWERMVSLNTWQALPESKDVVGMGVNEGKVFLGVATSPNFPVDIAQRQVDNGWGAYETHDEDGQMTSVFIPAGGSMFVSGEPRLYAVWGSA